MNDKNELLKSKNINLDDVLKKEATGIDGLDLGKVIEIGETFIVIQRGLVEKKKYHLPISSIKSFDGEFISLEINETNLKSYEQTEDNLFTGYSSFKSSDMSKEVQTTIPLIDEKLEITKKTIEENLEIIKKPIKETKTVELELMYDKVTIMKRPLKENTSTRQIESNAHKLESNSPGIQIGRKVGEEEDWRTYDKSTQIIVTLEREEPIIVKRSRVKEEILVKKQTLFETKTITEQVVHEYLKSNDVEL